ncbi:MAG TPA: ParB/RepB/Spo0J family partition protein [Blastocatellia bacterium]|nr:ParB/RepB/Spo0J family partition protein [Blastocatellia bacterium]
MSKRGLPSSFKLRHDVHYVEQLANRSGGAPVGRMIPIDKLAPNPNQPRTEFGDLSELIASIQEKGVLEPLLVRPSDVGGRYMIIAGERRYRASLQVGLTEVPCIELDVDDKAVAEISLIENLQRKDLNAFEEADGLQALADRFGYTHEEIARKLGKSRTSVTETLSIASMPTEVREQCRRADIASKSMLLQVVRLPSAEEMAAFVGKIRESGLTRDQARNVRKGKAKEKEARGFVYRYAPKGGAFSVTVKFKKGKVSRDDIEAAITDAAAHLAD